MVPAVPDLAIKVVADGIPLERRQNENIGVTSRKNCILYETNFGQKNSSITYMQGRVAWFSKSAQKRLQTILVIPMGTNSWNLEEERARSNARLAKRVRSFTIRASIGNWCGLDFSRIWRVFTWKYCCKSNKTLIWTYIDEKKCWKPEYLIPRLAIWKILFTTVSIVLK